MIFLDIFSSRGANPKFPEFWKNQKKCIYASPYGLKGLQLELLQCRIYIVEVWMVAAWWICIRIWQKRCFAAIYQKQISASQLDIFRQGGGGGGLGSISIRQITSQAVWLSQLADSALKARARPWWQSTASGAILLRGHLTRCLYPGCM